LLLRAATGIAIIFNVADLGHALSFDLNVHLLLLLDIFDRIVEFFDPSLEILRQSCNLLIPLFLFLIVDVHLLEIFKVQLKFLHKALRFGHLVTKELSEHLVVRGSAELLSVFLKSLN
jgi:hypothetical protein